MQVPLVIVDKPFYIAMDPERSFVELSNADRKSIYSQVSQLSTYITLAISILARSCCLVKKQSQAVIQAPMAYSFAMDTSLANARYIPETEELTLLQSFKKLNWWSLTGHQKVHVNAVSLLFAYVCTDNDSASASYIKTLTNFFT